MALSCFAFSSLSTNVNLQPSHLISLLDTHRLQQLGQKWLQSYVYSTARLATVLRVQYSCYFYFRSFSFQDLVRRGQKVDHAGTSILWGGIYWRDVAMEGEAPNEGGCSVAATYSTYCCENHVAPGIGLIEPEKSFCDITARTPTLRSVVTRSPTPRHSPP